MQKNSQGGVLSLRYILTKTHSHKARLTILLYMEILSKIKFPIFLLLCVLCFKRLLLFYRWLHRQLGTYVPLKWINSLCIKLYFRKVEKNWN